MRSELLAHLGVTETASVAPLALVADRVRELNEGLKETNLLSLSYGNIIRKDIDEGGGLRPESYEGYNIIQPDDIVLRMTDLQNDQRSLRSARTTQRGIITSAYITVRPRDNVDPTYLAWYLRVFDLSKAFYQMGAGVRQTLNFDELGQIPVIVPPLDEQSRIANYLDREIAEMDAMNTDLDALIETLTERRGRMPHHILSALFSEAPLHPLWSILSPKKDQGHPDEQVLSVYRAYGVILKDSREDNNNRTPENVSSYQLVEPGDLVVNKMKAWQGSLGVSAHRGIVSPDYQVCRVISDNVDSDYLHVVLRSAHMVPQYRVRSKGVRPAQWRLYWEDMSPLGIPLPSLDEQRRVVAELDANTARIDAMVADAERLKALLAQRKSTLTTEAVTGRKEVPAA